MKYGGCTFSERPCHVESIAAMKRYIFIPLLLFVSLLIAAVSASNLLTAPPDNTQTKQAAEAVVGTGIEVGKGWLSFDPATCKRGSAGFGWGLGSVRVEILGREKGHCIFDFTNEIEGGYLVHRCKAPVTTRQVKIYVDNGDIATSFDLKQSKVVASGNLLLHGPDAKAPKWSAQSVTGTSYVNYVSPLEPGKGAAAKQGDQVTLRVTLLASDLKTPWIGVKPLEISFALGEDKVDPAIAAAAEGMKPGGAILAKVRSEVLPAIATKVGGIQTETQVAMKIQRLR